MKQIIIKLTEHFYQQIMNYKVDAPTQLVEAVRHGKVADGKIRLELYGYDGNHVVIECDSFEFRTNYVSNWVRAKSGDTVITIYDVATIKGRGYEADGQNNN